MVITGPSRLGKRVHVKPHCVIESTQLDDDVQLGPAAHLRPGCHLRSRVKIGNYVEGWVSRRGGKGTAKQKSGSEGKSEPPEEE